MKKPRAYLPVCLLLALTAVRAGFCSGCGDLLQVVEQLTIP